MSEQKHSPEIILLDWRSTRPLQSGVIHLYVVPISGIPHNESELNFMLNQDEHARADRFINPEHGRNFRKVRGLLRHLLTQYVDVAPQILEFNYTEYGKPFLKGGADLQFNLSHSRDMVAYAFSLDHELGVDIEYMRPQKDLDGMIRYVCSEKEQVELKAMKEEEVMDAFYRLWTRKEAFIKACGRGLGMGLRSIHVGTGESRLPLVVEYKNKILPMWFMQDIKPPINYKMAKIGRAHV